MRTDGLEAGGRWKEASAGSLFHHPEGERGEGMGKELHDAGSGMGWRSAHMG